MDSEGGHLFYTSGDSFISKTLTFVIEDRVYRNTFGGDYLNSRGLPHDKFHLAFLSPFENNIYQNTYSSYYIDLLPQKATVILTLRFEAPRREIIGDLEFLRTGQEFSQREIDFLPGQEEYHLELPLFDPNVDIFLQKINTSQQTYKRLYQLALQNNFMVTPCDVLTQEFYPGQTWKNVSIVRFLQIIVEIEKRIEDIYEIFTVHGRRHQLYELEFV